MTNTLKRLEEINQKLSEQVLVDPTLFAQITNSLPDGLLVINDKGLIQFVNEQIELLFGYPRASLIGEPVHMLLAPELAETHAKHIAQYFTHPTRRPMNLAKVLQGRNRNKGSVNVQISLGPLVSGGGVLALALVRRVDDGN